MYARLGVLLQVVPASQGIINGSPTGAGWAPTGSCRKTICSVAVEGMRGSLTSAEPEEDEDCGVQATHRVHEPLGASYTRHRFVWGKLRLCIGLKQSPD